ncbi:beta-1,6-N-acetylglucosaminyltransferase [Enterococcus casseliflavus]|uniref:beta-1,6-N-acetylglucosaminyltransferase n=1 Tax=Enterococcus casseliflavus TaxID=37734 RepID=UPI002953C66C|nr:beta-1,6-N-acetylglucosaminyltransferase [Enterococcus casseliflavus]MDV7712267.1 beta-1,6-N-acetylglucosaminyltransferase [Enterococcus casseliflavus]
MKKQAYLIMAHGNFENLSNLIKSLDYKFHDIFVHIDKQVTTSSIPSFKKMVEHANIHVYQKYKVSWGGYSQVLLQVDMLRTAYSYYNEYSYYHFLSGQDFPLHSPHKIYNSFEEKYPTNFIEIDNIFVRNKSNTEIIDRINLYHPFFDLPKLHRGIKTRSDVFISCFQKIMGINRLQPTDMIGKGSNWASITDTLCSEVLQTFKSSDFKKKYANTRSADEIFMQTILINSKKEFVYLNDNMVYVDWVRGNPYTFTLNNINELKDIPTKMYVRKVSESLSSELLKKIKEEKL